MANINTNTDQGEINYDICEKQGEIYEYMASSGYDIKQFSNLFLSSGFCNDCFDKCWSLYHDASPYESFYEKMEPEFGDRLTKYDDDKIFDIDAAYWIGFTYRQLAIETLIPSKELLHIIPFDELAGCYPGLHTVAEEYATDIICEYHKLTKHPDTEVKA